MTGDLALTWWGHASATVEMAAPGSPSTRCSATSSSTCAATRRTPTAEATDADVVLISHLHHDHLHLPSLRRFARDVPILVPRGGESLLRDLGADRVLPVEPGRRRTRSAARRSACWPPPTTAVAARTPRSPGPPLGFRVDRRRPVLLVPGRHRAARGHVRRRQGRPRPDPDRRLGPDARGRAHGPGRRRGGGRAGSGADVAVPVHWGTFWPVGLRRLARANHHRLFVTPGDRFLEALGTAAPDVRAVLATPGEPLPSAV